MFSAELPIDRERRWALLDQFLEHWFASSPHEHGVPASELHAAEQRLGLALPPAFREWYGRSGARHDVWSRQDPLLMPHELRVERDVLVFCRENQDVVQWGIRLDEIGDEDPPVVVSDPKGDAAWFVESATTSAFALQLAVLNAKWSGGSASANAQATDEVIAAVVRSYPRLPFPDLHWPPWPTRCYGNDDILIETHADTWIWASARTPTALAELDALVRAAGLASWDAYGQI